MENKENTFITLGGLRRFLDNLNVDIANQKTYLDNQDALTLATSKSYTDGAMNAAMTDATAKFNTAKANLNTHINNVTDAHDMANRLQALKVSMQDYTDQGIAGVVGGAPEMLNTLNELSNAIGNNANFSASMADLIGQKLNSLEVVNSPAINKILRLDANAQFPSSVITQDLNNRFFTDAERIKLAGIDVNANNYIHPINHQPSIITQDANNRFFTDSERAKLAVIQDGANNYVHPPTHPASIITQDTNNRFVSDAEITDWNSRATQKNVADSISNLVSSTVSPGSDGPNSLKKYIDDKDFLNLPPRIGFFGDKKVNLSGTFNMSYFAMYEKPFTIISDTQGREVIYFTASNGDTAVPSKLYKAFRMNSNDNFIFENDAVIPQYMNPGDYPIRVIGLGNTYIVYLASIGNVNQYHLVKTNGTSKQESWRVFKNITNIISGKSVSSVMYFDHYDTIAIVHIDSVGSDQIVTLSLFAYSDLHLIKTVALFNVSASIDPGTYSLIDKALYDAGAATYVASKNQLVWVACYTATYVDNIKADARYQIVNIFDIPNSFFSNGDGHITNLIASNEYKLDGSGKGLIRYSWGPYTITYDDYNSCIRTGLVFRDTVVNKIWNVNSLNRPLDAGYITQNPNYYLELSTPDTCPWAKIQYKSACMGNNLYFNSFSNKYGTARSSVKYKSVGSQQLETVSGSWWLPSKYENVSFYYQNIQCVRINATTTKWFYPIAGQPLSELIFSDFIDPATNISYSGKRSLQQTSYPPCPVPSTQYSILVGCYHPNLNKYFFLVCDNTPADPLKQGYVFLISYNCATGVWLEHRNICQELIDFCKGSFESFKDHALIVPMSNFFIDLDGSIFINLMIRYSTAQSYFVGFRMMPQSDGSVVYSRSTLDLGAAWTKEAYVSYDSNFGYCASGGDNFKQSIIYCSKDYVSGGVEKTANQFFNGDVYTVTFGLAGSIGLVANLIETPIFIGGYYSVIPSQEINLYKNSDNYIYLVRDSYDRSKVNVEVRTKMISGGISFGRILVSKITTNDALITAQVDYPIQDEYVPITHLGSNGISQHALGDGINVGFSTNDYTTTEKNKLAGIANNANNYTHPDTHPVDMFTGVLPLEKGGTGTTSKQGIVQMLGSDGDKNSITDISNIFTFVFESGGSRCGYLGFNEIKTKVQWSTAELQNALANLPNI